MPITTTRTGRIATAHELAAAAGITTDIGVGYQLVDRYGVTYSGIPAHMVLVALARPDLTPDLYRDHRDLADAVRVTARRLALWFTCQHVDADHAAGFAALPPGRVCELVAHVVNRGHRDALAEVGPESLRFYTGYLLSAAVDDADVNFPNVVDKPRRGLTGVFDDRIPVEVTATAPDGADEVQVRMEIEATESIHWKFVADVAVPTDQVNHLLMDPGWALGSWLGDNRELIDDHLDYALSGSEEGIDTDVHLVAPDTPLTHPGLAEPAVGPARADVALFFVGPDRDTALTAGPFLDRAEAGTIAAALDHQVFTTEADLSAAYLRNA